MSWRKLTNYGLATATTVLSTPSLFTFFSHERRDILWPSIQNKLNRINKQETKVPSATQLQWKLTSNSEELINNLPRPNRVKLLTFLVVY